jgi:hypothetical protein
MWAFHRDTERESALARCAVDVLPEPCVISRGHDCSHSPPASILMRMASRHDGMHINTILHLSFILPHVPVRSFIWNRRVVYRSTLCRWAGLEHSLYLHVIFTLLIKSGFCSVNSLFTLLNVYLMSDCYVLVSKQLHLKHRCLLGP